MPWLNTRVCHNIATEHVLSLITFFDHEESIRYLDVHRILPDDAPPELADSYKALLSPLLLNSALAAVRAQPPSAFNAETAVKSATRALTTLELNNADKGFLFFLFWSLLSLLMMNFSQGPLPSRPCPDHVKR